MKVLLLGKTGLLGHALFDVLKEEYQVVAPDHTEADITDTSSLEKIFSKIHPEIVINATGFTKVDSAETKPKEAFLINSEGVSNLVQCCSKRTLPLIHFSTDYVFNGKKQEGYLEEDLPSPVSLYGASKAEGEKAVITNLSHFFLIRTSWLFGPGGRNFVDTMINQSHKNEGAPLSVVNDQKGNPTYTLDLARAVFALLRTKNYGIYHMVNSGSCTWYEFAEEIFRLLGVPQRIIPITSEALNRPAKRPAYSILKSSKLPKLRPWKEALAEYLQEKTLIL